MLRPDVMKRSRVAVCSIVRDCEKNLKRNIRVIEKLRTLFRASTVIVFENDSVDGTKAVLSDWARTSPNVHIDSRDLHVRTIPTGTAGSSVNKYFSFSRISKLSEFRNQYLQKLTQIGDEPDYVIVVDLDISKIFIEGILHSFSLADRWDVICANGYSYSPSLKRRYHDAYALTELGQEEQPQTEASIAGVRKEWGALRPGMPLIPVYSAFGGLSIYRYQALANTKYYAPENSDPRVQVRCEHYALCRQIRNNGFSRIYVNPGMEVKYQSIDYALVKKYIKDALER